MLFKNILVPYDDSKCALHAFKIAVTLAKTYNSKLTVVTCTLEPHTDSWYFDNRIATQILKEQKKAATESFSKLEKISKKAGVKITTNVLPGHSIVKNLVSFAKDKKIDLIVMGTHGKTGWDKVILGSVANGVSQKVMCPVLLAR